jgi:hypothetical protein
MRNLVLEATPPNKGMKLAKPGPDGASQLILSVRQLRIWDVVNCQRCGAGVAMPNLSAEVKRRNSGLTHRVGRMQAMIELKDQATLGLAQANRLHFILLTRTESAIR